MPSKTNYKGFKGRLQAAKTPVSSAIGAVFTAGYLLKAYGMEAIGLDLLRRQSDTSIDQFFSPNGRARILKNNRAGIKVKGLLPSVKQGFEALEKLLKQFEHAQTGFETFKTQLQTDARDPHNPRQLESANNLTRIQNVETELRSIRVPNFDMIEVKNRLEVLKDLIEKDEVDDPRTILAYVDSQLKALTKHVKEKKEADLKKIQAQITIISTPPAILSPEDTAKLKNDLLKNCNETYDKFEQAVKKEFEDGIPAAKEGEKATLSIKATMEKEVDKAESELFNLVLFSEKTKSKEVVETSNDLGLYGANRGRKYRNITFEEYINDQPQRSSAWLSGQSWAEYGQYLLNNRAELHALSGMRLKHDGQGNISINFPSGFSTYYHYQDRLLGADLMLMIEAVKRAGKDEVTLTLDVHDPKLRQKIMEEFYYAAILSGFPPDKIKFNITMTEDPSKSISNKTANEIMGQLGNAPKRASAKQQSWQQEKVSADKEATTEVNRRVADLDEKIDDILNQPALHARNN